MGIGDKKLTATWCRSSICSGISGQSGPLRLAAACACCIRAATSILYHAEGRGVSVFCNNYQAIVSSSSQVDSDLGAIGPSAADKILRTHPAVKLTSTAVQFAVSRQN